MKKVISHIASWLTGSDPVTGRKSSAKSRIMTKKYIPVFLMAIFMFGSCEENPVVNEEETAVILNGWEISKSPLGFHIHPRALFFTDTLTGFVVGYNGEIYKTKDSGESWQKQNSGTTLHLHSVYFVNQNTGFASGQAMSGCLDEDCNKGCVFLRTSDGGETWTKKFFPDYVAVKSLHFFNESTGLALIYTPDVPNSRDYYIARTENGGDSWELIDLAIKPTYERFYGIGDVVFIAGENQKIFKSKDRGDSWQIISTPVPASYRVRNLYFCNEQVGFIDGVSAFYKTTDGGANWETVDFPFIAFGVCHFYSETEGFNVLTVTAYEGGDFPAFKGSQGYETTDGGNTWSRSGLNHSIYLGLTCFPEKDRGYGINGSEFYVIKRK
jgi:photosystem II stability/assembly factor-like uncharacterized protein